MKQTFNFFVEWPSYATMILLGLLFSLLCACKRMKLYNYNNRHIVFIFVFSVAGMGIGSKLLFFMTRLPYVFTDIQNFSFIKLLMTFVASGFVFYGGLFGAILGTCLCSRILNENKEKMCSFVTPCFVLFHVFGRIGCFLGGCCYGIPWKYGIAMQETPNITRVPVQLFESGFELIIFFVLLQLEKHNYKNLFLKYLLMYAPIRFGLEYLRGDAIRGVWGWFSTSQLISLIILGVIMIKTLYKKIRLMKRKKCSSQKKAFLSGS